MAKNIDVVDLKPKMKKIPYTDFGTERLFTVVINKGQPMGLSLALTYPTAGTVQSPVTN